MVEFKIVPHVGIGPIRLGVSRADGCACLCAVGFPREHSHGHVDYFCKSAIQFKYDQSERIQFIGLACHRAYRLTYEGIDVFDLPAPQVFAEIAARDGSGAHEYHESGYLFPNQIVALWEADTQYDRLGGEQRVIWGQVGIGNQQYLDAIRAINKGRINET